VTQANLRPVSLPEKMRADIQSDSAERGWLL